MLSYFSVAALFAVLSKIFTGGVSYSFRGLSLIICRYLTSIVQVNVIRGSKCWSPTTVGGFLASICLPLVDTQVTLKLSISSLLSVSISCPLPFFLLVWERFLFQNALRLQFKFHSKWLRNHPLVGSSDYERRKKEHRRHKSWAKKSLKTVAKELKLSQLVELLAGYERLIQEIRVAELLTRYENLIALCGLLLSFCVFLIGGLLDLAKYLWLSVPLKPLSVDDKFYLSVIVPNGSIVMVLVSNDSTVLEAKQAASVAVGLPIEGLQLFQPARYWKRLTSGATLSGLGLNPSSLVRLGSRPRLHSRLNTTKTSTPILTSNQSDSVILNPAIIPNTASPNPRLSQTISGQPKIPSTKKSHRNSGIWFSDMNPQVSSSWSPSIFHPAMGDIPSLNWLSAANRNSTSSLVTTPPISSLVIKKPRLYLPPYEPITLIDFILPRMLPELGLSIPLKLVDSSNAVITIPQGLSPPPEPPPPPTLPPPPPTLVQQLQPKTVIKTSASRLSFHSISFDIWRKQGSCRATMFANEW